MPGICCRFPELPRRLAGFLRALACLLALLALTLLSTLRAAQARLGEELHGFGAELVRWQPNLHGSPRRFFINGLELGLVTASSKARVGEALDRFHALCKKRGGLPGGVDGALREESESEGFVACLDTGSPLELAELGARLEEFARTGDLQAIGQLRYVFARRSGEQTTLLVLWTDGAAALSALLPTTGDAPGQDPRDFPRAPGLRRLLSASEHGAPYSLAVYTTESQPAHALQGWYERSLRAESWSVSPGCDGLLVARKADRTVLLRVATTRSGRTSLSLSEL